MKNLRRYAKDDAKEGDRDASLKELSGDNDRAFVILVGSFTERILTDAVKAKFPNLDAATEAELFASDRPLGTFSAKIRIGYALGLYGRETKRHLERIREMRNACAHSARPISFETPEMEAVTLTLPDHVPEQFRDKPSRAKYLRNRFNHYTLIVQGSLLGEGAAPGWRRDEPLP